MIEFEYEIIRDNDLVARGYTKLIFLNSKTQKPIRCPDFLLNKINLDK